VAQPVAPPHLVTAELSAGLLHSLLCEELLHLRLPLQSLEMSDVAAVLEALEGVKSSSRSMSDVPLNRMLRAAGAPGVSNLCDPFWLRFTYAAPVLVTKYRGWKRLDRRSASPALDGAHGGAPPSAGRQCR
jgi:hypothetical protein